MYRTGVRIALTTLCALACSTGCTDDALYTYCFRDEQCGSRFYDDGDEEIELFLTCIEVTIDDPTAPDPVMSRGNFCTIDCFTDSECDSRIGLPDGACIRLDGDDLSFCYQRCDADTPCYPSSRCETLMDSGAPVQVCVPDRLPP